jgi:hypothetical protein
MCVIMLNVDEYRDTECPIFMDMLSVAVPRVTFLLLC